MKRTTFIAAVLCLLGAGLSCTHEEPSKSERNDGNNVHEWEDSTLSGDAVMSEPMQFNMGNRLTVTRATTAFDGQSYTLSVGDRVMIELTRSDNTKEGPKVYRVTNAVTGALAYDGNETEALFWKSKSETVRLRAWSYGNSTSDTTDPVGKTFTLNTTQTETSSGIDNYNELLYAPQWSCSYSDHNGSVEVNLYHQMSRLALTLTHEATGDLSVNQVTIGNGSMPTTAKFSETGIDVANNDYVGSWTNLSTNTGTIIARQDVANQKYSAVLFPGTYAADTKLVNVKTTNSKTYSYLLPTGGATLDAGSQYNYTITVKDAPQPQVGDYFYADGTWSTNYETGHGAVVGLVFSTNPSAADRAAGYTHGYVVALTNIQGVAWSTTTGLTGMGVIPLDADDARWWNAISGDFDGLSHTNYIKTTYASTYITAFPAFNAALTYGVSVSKDKVNNSGWYLPSTGQMYALLYNFCNKVATWPGVNLQRWIAAHYDGMGWYYETVTANNLNSYFNQRLNTDIASAGGTTVSYSVFYRYSPSRNYWTSTEYNENYAYVLHFGGSESLGFLARHNGLEKTVNGGGMEWNVRPVLAF